MAMRANTLVPKGGKGNIHSGPGADCRVFPHYSGGLICISVKPGPGPAHIRVLHTNCRNRRIFEFCAPRTDAQVCCPEIRRNRRIQDILERPCNNLGNRRIRLPLGHTWCHNDIHKQLYPEGEWHSVTCRPLTNFVIFAAFLLMSVIFNPASNTYLYHVFSFVIFISILLAFFNMLPVYPLDGSKVLRWNKPVYAVVMAVIFALMVLFTGIGLLNILIIIGVAIAFSLFYKFSM